MYRVNLATVVSPGSPLPNYVTQHVRGCPAEAYKADVLRGYLPMLEGNRLGETDLVSSVMVIKAIVEAVAGEGEQELSIHLHLKTSQASSHPIPPQTLMSERTETPLERKSVLKS